MAEIASRDSNRVPVLMAADSVFQQPTQVYVNSSTHRLLVDAAITVDNLTVSENIAQINGATISLGQAAMISSFPVVIASDQTALPVTGTFYQAIQPVSIASLPALASGSNVIGHVIVDSGTITSVTAITNALPAGSNILGKVSQDTSPWVISGAVTEAALDAAIISQEATTSGVKGMTMFGAVTTSKPTYTTGKSDALSLDVNGLLRISLADTPANSNKFLVTADAITIASAQTLATVTTVTTVSNLSQIASITPTFGDINNSATETGALNTAPVGRYNATQPTLTDTRYNQLQVSLRGELLVSPGVSNFAVQATLATETTKVIGTVNISSGQTIGLAAGSQVIGHVIVDSGTITTVSAVTAITNALPAGTNLIGDVGHGKTIKTATGSVASSGDNTIVNAVSSKRIKVIAYALFYASTTSNTLTFKDNTAGTGVWTVILQAPAANTVFGANLAIDAPSFLFASLAGDPLVLNLGQAVSVTYSITYFDDDAS